MKYTLLFSLIISQFTAIAQIKNTVSGKVYEKGSREHLPNVNISVVGKNISTTSNAYGFYSITLPVGTYTLAFSFVGFGRVLDTVRLTKNVDLDVEMSGLTELKEVKVSGERREKVSEQTQMSTINIPVQAVKDVPALLGEKDVLKIIQLMPGVQKGSEGQSGIYVRGGGPDQNLIILDDATVYNAFHLFGFFSLFNGDALKSIELIKGGFPARYGGRLSSVIDMQMKDGNKAKLIGEGGLGVIASRLVLEGPLLPKQLKHKSSFLVSGRSTYINLLMRPIIRAASDGLNDGGYNFFDLNAKLNYEIDKNNKVYLSGYFGRDKFFFQQNEPSPSKDYFRGGFLWGNATGTLRWNHKYDSKWFSNTSLIFSDYRFEVFAKLKEGTETFDLNFKSGIRDIGVKYDNDYFHSPEHHLKFGAAITYHQFSPSAVVIKSSVDTSQNVREINTIKTYESGIYIEDLWKYSNKLKLNPGLRISTFSVGNVTYTNPEPRISVAYTIKANLAVKASYAMMNQYLHLLSNSGIGLPTDLWVPATGKIKPMQSQQVAIGIAKDIDKPDLSITVEAYYKKMNRVLAYKEGASFLSLDAGPNNGNGSTNKSTWEDKVTQGQGWSYGAEFFVQKKVGQFTGWIGYTLSWTQLQFDELNFGKKYYARYDRRHDLSIVGMYKINKEWKISGTFIFGTGQAITLPLQVYPLQSHTPLDKNGQPINYSGSPIGQYQGLKNSARMEPYHRMDIGVQHTKKKKWGESTVEFSAYNVYSRWNPYFYYIGSDAKGNPALKKVSLFPIVPTVTWNFKF